MSRVLWWATVSLFVLSAAAAYGALHATNLLLEEGAVLPGLLCLGGFILTLAYAITFGAHLDKDYRERP